MQDEANITPDQQQLGQPFRISNRGLDGIVRYLTLNKPHQHEKRYLAEFDLKRSK